MTARQASLWSWLLLVMACLAVIFERLELSYDLAYFLPEATTPAEQILRDRAGDTPGARLLFGVILAPEASRAQELASQLSSKLQPASEFTRILSSSSAVTPSEIPQLAWRYRYLLDERELTSKLLDKELKERLADLVLLPGHSLAEFIASDPTLASLRVLERVRGATEMPPSFEIVGRKGSLVVLETRAPPFDLGGQRIAVQRLRGEFESLRRAGETLEVLGMGAYGLGVQDTIRKEATFRSALASILVLTVLLVAFRDIGWAGLAVLPVAIGFVCGLAVIALVFGKIHGLTLAFGATILGIAVDYPVHVLSHARKVGLEQSMRATLPSIWIGAASTAIAFLALVLTGSSGLAQLAVFSLVGVLTAAAATQWLLPYLPSEPRAVEPNGGGPDEQLVPNLSFLPMVFGLTICGALLLAADDIWSDDLSAMTPIAKATLLRDHQLREAIGAPDLRHVIAVTANTEQEALREAERLEAVLTSARVRGLIESWLSPALLLPSEKTQELRRAQLPLTEDLSQWIARATEEMPFRADAFRPFVEAVDASRRLHVTRDDVQNSEFGTLLESLSHHSAGTWTNLITLYGRVDARGLSEHLQQSEAGAKVFLVDLKAASESLVAHYRSKSAIVVGVAFAAILVLLGVVERNLIRAIWIIGSVVSALGLTVAAVYLASGPLSVFHFVSLLVVAGLGLDYGLFYSKSSSDQGIRNIRHAVLICVASTSATFGVLAFSSIPILAAIGTTITFGCLFCWGLSRLGARSAA